MDKELAIREYLLQGIVNHYWTDKLPSEYDLVTKFAATRKTVRNVYKTMESMGLIYAQKGVGHFVHAKRPTIDLGLKNNTSFTEKMKQLKIPFHSQHISTKCVDEDQGIYEVCRLRFIESLPVALHYSYVSQKMFPDITGVEITSMYQYYQDHGFKKFENKDVVLTVIFPTQQEQILLDCKDLVPLIALKRKCYSVEQDILLEDSYSVYRSDVFKYQL